MRIRVAESELQAHTAPQRCGGGRQGDGRSTAQHAGRQSMQKAAPLHGRYKPQASCFGPRAWAAQIAFSTVM